jgi:hypothetical protein
MFNGYFVFERRVLVKREVSVLCWRVKFSFSILFRKFVVKMHLKYYFGPFILPRRAADRTLVREPDYVNPRGKISLILFFT